MKLPRVLLAASLLALALPALARGTYWLRPIPAQDSWSREECDRFLAASNAGAPLDLTFVVESADPADGHAPVAGAEVRWLCPPPLSWGPPPDDEKGSFAAVSDTNGIARLQGVATNWPGSSAMFSSALTPPLYSRDPRLPGVRFPALRVSREGFYTRLSPMALGPPDESGAWTAAPADGSGWGVEGECLLRRVRRPHPMRVSSFAAGADFPEGPVGYDAGRGAFLPPLGDGETADFFVESGQTPGAWPCATYRWIVVRPAGPDGALALVPAFPDELRTPNEVPGPSMPGSDLPFLPPGVPLRFLHPFRWGRTGAVFGTGCTALSNEMWNHCVPPEATADEGGGLAAHNAVVFRSRVRPAADGGAAAVRYGAIVLPDIDDERLCPARFLVRFNETDGERGLEPAELHVPEPAALAAAAPAGERLVEGPWAYRFLDGGRGVALAGFDAIPETPGGVLALPAELGGRPVVEIEPAAFSTLRFDGSETSRFFDRRDAARWWRTNALQLVVPEGVRRIGARAFAGFAPARTLSLPSTLETLGRECFVDCIRLESVALPPSVAAVPSAAFQGCLALRSAAAPGARTIAPFAFAQCPDLAAVRLAPGAEIDPWAFRDSPHAELSSHAEAAEPEPHAEIAEPAEPEPHAEAAEEKQ